MVGTEPLELKTRVYFACDANEKEITEFKRGKLEATVGRIVSPLFSDASQTSPTGYRVMYDDPELGQTHLEISLTENDVRSFTADVSSPSQLSRQSRALIFYQSPHYHANPKLIGISAVPKNL